MKKHVFGRQLSRDINERKALFKGLINSLVMLESIQTTEAKAKSIRGEVEKLITKAKRKGEASRSLLQPWLQPEALEKVMHDLSTRFANRPGGYTRMMKLDERFGDNAKMVVIELVEKKVIAKEMAPKSAVKTEKLKAEVTAKKETKVKTTKETKPTKKPTKDTKRKEAQEKKNTPKKGSK